MEQRTRDQVTNMMFNLATQGENRTRCTRRGVAALACPSSNDHPIVVALNTVTEVNGSDGCTGMLGDCGCEHAEAKLVVRLLNSRGPLGLWMFCSLSPCVACAHLIARSGLFTHVYWGKSHRTVKKSTRILRAANIIAEKWWA